MTKNLRSISIYKTSKVFIKISSHANLPKQADFVFVYIRHDLLISALFNCSLLRLRIITLNLSLYILPPFHLPSISPSSSKPYSVSVSTTYFILTILLQLSFCSFHFLPICILFPSHYLLLRQSVKQNCSQYNLLIRLFRENIESCPSSWYSRWRSDNVLFNASWTVHHSINVYQSPT